MIPKNRGQGMDKQTVLKQTFGYSKFRPGQERLIDALLAGRDVLGVMPTGGGKSRCYHDDPQHTVFHF